MFSVAVKGYGIVIWDDDGEWRTFAPTDSMSAVLADRVAYVLDAVPVPADERDVREALLSMGGAGLLSASCEHGPGECEGESGPP